MKNSQIKEVNKQKREGLTLLNNQGYKMKLIEYYDTRNIVVEFEDGIKVNSSWQLFKLGRIKKPEERINRIFNTKEGYQIKVITFNSYSDVTVEFQDKWKYVTHTTWGHCKEGAVRNKYHPNQYGGIVGDIRPYKNCKEYQIWYNILTRCYDDNFHSKSPTYSCCEVCEEWKYYWNFYDWLHSQSNFQQWLNGATWAVDKDILIKNNKIYSPQTCCLVPREINNILLKSNKIRGNLPIGVTYRKNDKLYEAQCNNPLINRYVTIGVYKSPEKAFQAYKEYKENIIKEMAKNQYQINNITEQCYNALMSYNVEITD